VDATVLATDVGVYGDVDLRLGKLVHVRGGARADLLVYDLDDRLGNFIPVFQRQQHIVGYRRTAIGVAAGPRATVEVEPANWLTVLASYGEGYRSPQALQLEEGENAPFTKVRGMEVGAKLKPGAGERLSLTASGYVTFLSNDLAFDPGDNRLERIGPTRRAGVVTYLLAHPTHWSLASLSVTYVNAVLTAPPVASVANPSPPYVPGQLLPYVPPIVVRADASVNREFTLFGRVHLDARAGAGFTFLSPRPLPYGQFAEPVALLDLSAGVRVGPVGLTLEVYNVVGTRYAATEYSFVSNWQTTDIPSRIPARTISAGAPRTFVGSISVSF
jgi:outer membrane receptor protein involved in Fe transport